MRGCQMVRHPLIAEARRPAGHVRGECQDPLRSEVATAGGVLLAGFVCAVLHLLRAGTRTVLA
jgi:hypothetical protein